jgi:hypothetical protein
MFPYSDVLHVSYDIGVICTVLPEYGVGFPESVLSSDALVIRETGLAQAGERQEFFGIPSVPVAQFGRCGQKLDARHG